MNHFHYQPITAVANKPIYAGFACQIARPCFEETAPEGYESNKVLHPF